jgi:hypothetical protein
VGKLDIRRRVGTGGSIGTSSKATMTDSAGASEHGKGAGRVAWEPERSGLSPRGSTGITEHRLNNAPDPTIALEIAGSAEANTRNPGAKT